MSQPNQKGCLRACIASLLEFPIEQVPDFMEIPDDPKHAYPGWYLGLQDWLSEYGFALVEFRVAGTVLVEYGEEVKKHEIFTLWNPLPHAVLAIFAGPMKDGIRHMLIGTCQDGEFVPQFDPHPETPGIGRVESVCFLIPRDPNTMAKMGRALAKIEALAGAQRASTVAHAILDTAREALGKPLLMKSSIILPNARS